MAEVKVTKTQMFEAIKGVVEVADVAEKEDMIKFLDHQIELIADKAAKAKARATAKKTDGDALRATVEAVLTDEFQLVDDITVQVEGEEVTRAKVVARLKQLVDAGVAEKDTIKVDKSKKVAYRLVAVKAADVE